MAPATVGAGKPPRFDEVVRFILRYMRPENATEVLTGITCLTFIVVAKVAYLSRGLFVKLAVDSLQSDDLNVRRRGPVRAALLFLFGRAVMAVAHQCFESTQEAYARRVSRRIAVAAFGAAMHQSVTFHEGRRVGATAEVIRRGVDALNTLLRQVGFFLFPTLLEAAYLCLLFFKLRLHLVALVVVITIVTNTLHTTYLTSRRANVAAEQAASESKAAAHLAERLTQHAAVSAFGAEHDEINCFDKLQAAVQSSACYAQRCNTFFNFSSDLIMQLGTAACFLLSARQAAEGILSVGDFTLAVSYVSALFWPLLVLTRTYSEVVTALAHSKDLFELIHAPNDVQDMPNANELPMPRPGHPYLEFEDVSYRHPDGCGVNGISLSVCRGKVVGIVGPSGAGKSTLLRMTLRLLDVQSGVVRVHGADVRTVTKRSLRSHVALVAQETAIFQGTLRDNVRYARKNASDMEVMRVLRLAHLENFLKTLPNGLETLVGERGVRLSGGERQRVGIARALLMDADVLVLDEATSSLSAIDERAVVQGIGDTMRDCAVLIVAHRLATVRGADEIVVLKDGCVEQRGTHESLMASVGLYSEMWILQSGGRPAVN